MKPPRRGVAFDGPEQPKAAPLLWDDVPEAPPEPDDRGAERISSRAPVTPDALFRAATFYLARYAAPTARLREVLVRKVRRRCEARDVPAPEAAELRALVDGVVERLTRAGLIDDGAYARGRAAALTRKGWPPWRIEAELKRQGVVPDEGVAEMAELDEAAQARRLAERKRLGPYRAGEREPYRDRDVRALVRAGFPAALAIRVVDGEAE